MSKANTTLPMLPNEYFDSSKLYVVNLLPNVSKMMETSA